MEIKIIKIGYPQVDINKVNSIINNTQKLYRANYEPETSIPNIGRPDLPDYAYSDKLFFEKINQYIDKARLTLGITYVQLEDDWWIRPLNDDRSAMIITTYEAESLINRAKRTLEDFVVFKVITCILTSEYFRRSGKLAYRNSNQNDDLIHVECRNCLFDFCPNKQDRAKGFLELKICDHCRGKLVNGNVPIENIKAIESVMNYLKKPSLKKSAYSIQQNPYLSALIGMGIGILINTISNFSLKTNIILILLFTFGTLIGTFLYDLFKQA
jgi:hypothetical protein